MLPRYRHATNCCCTCSRAFAEGSSIKGKVVLVERLGGTSHVHLDVGASRLMAVVSGESLPAVGDVLGVTVPPARAHLFDAAGASCRVR